MKSTFVALSTELLLCSATGKADIPAVTHDDMLRLIGGQRIGPDEPETSIAKAMIVAGITGGLYGSGELQRLVEADPRWAQFLIPHVWPISDFWGGMDEKLLTARSGTVQRKKSTS